VLIDHNTFERHYFDQILNKNYNLKKVQYQMDRELLKKITSEIWEFRTLYNGQHYRLLAFWDTSSSKNSLVVATNGFIKKKSKVPIKEIQKATQIRQTYLHQKSQAK
jgi:hypothetical protein